jgi:serine phosphatase RsbU (regulator of sigma subunit)
MIVDLVENRAYYANAGHPKPMLMRGGTDEAQVEMLQSGDGKSNPALGLFDCFRYTTASVALNPGDRFVFFTDGVYDVERDGELLSPEWLRGALRQRNHLPLSTIFDELLQELREFSAGQEFCDDMCLVGMEVKGQ